MKKSISIKTRVKTIAQNLQPLFTTLPIEAVYLYGSRSSERFDLLSDHDFGLVFSDKITSNRRFDLRLSLFGDIAAKLNVAEDSVDVVDLKSASALLQFNAISGSLLYCRDEEKRVVFETYVMSRYHDEHYYYDRYLEEMLHKIKKGVYFDRRLPYS